MEYAGAYDAANGESRGVIPALYLIYGTCLPEGKIGYLPENIVKRNEIIVVKYGDEDIEKEEERKQTKKAKKKNKISPKEKTKKEEKDEIELL